MYVSLCKEVPFISDCNSKYLSGMERCGSDTLGAQAHWPSSNVLLLLSWWACSGYSTVSDWIWELTGG